VVAWQIEQAMKTHGPTKVAMAERTHTRRAQPDRLLDPNNTKVQPDTIPRAAAAIGHRRLLKLA